MSNPPTEPVAKHQVKGYTFQQLCDIAEGHGFNLEYNAPDGDGGGDEYELYSNQHAPGVTGVYETLAEAAGDVLCLERGENPLDPDGTVG